MDPIIGRTLGQYEIISRLGAGGMATVYRARQKSVDRYVAIKVIKEELASTQDFLQRFEREAKTVANLSHPHILKVFDYGHQESTVYLVMELLEGGSLSKYIAVNGALSAPVTSRMMGQIGQALDYAHAQSIVHRDLKPENVLLDKSQNAFLTDFGIAKLLNETGTTLTQTGIVMGTPAYMAPELWDGQPADARTDIYAFGILLYNMITGTLPFVGATPMRIMYMHVNGDVPPPSTINTSVTPTVDAVIRKALAKTPDQRFATAGELVAAYQRASGESSSAAIPLSQRPTPASASTPSSPTATRGRVAFDPEATDRVRTPQQGISAQPSGGQAATLPRAKRRSSGGLILGIVGALIALALIGGLVFSNLSAQRDASATATAQFSAILAGSQTAIAALATGEGATVATSTAAANGTGTTVALNAQQTADRQTADQTGTAVAALVQTDAAATVTGALTAQAAAQVAASQTAEALFTATFTPTSTTDAVQVAMLTEAAQPTDTATPSPTSTMTATPTGTATATATATATFTDTATATVTPSFTATITPTPTNTFTPTLDPNVVAAMTLAPLQTGTQQAANMQATISTVLTREGLNFVLTQTAAAVAVQLTQAAQIATEAAQAKATLTRVAAEIAATQTALARPLVITVTPDRNQPIRATVTTLCAGFLPSRLAVGMTGRVTPGDPNRLRTTPSRSGSIIGQIPGGRIFRVVDGPICADGSAWWQVEYNSLIGWTIEGENNLYYLDPVTTPVPGIVQCPNFMPSRLTVGKRARVTPGDSNSLNSLPARPSVNPDSQKLGSIRAGESFLVLSGPVCGDDGYVWWQVNFNGVVGWTAEGRPGSPYWLEPIP